MSTGAELGQHILQTHNSNKITKIQWGLIPLDPFISGYASAFLTWSFEQSV